MKLLLFLTIIVLSIGTIPQVFGKEYLNDEYKFKLEFPDNWATDEEKFAFSEASGWTLIRLYPNVIDDGYPELANLVELYGPLLRIAVHPDRTDVKEIATTEYEEKKNDEIIDYSIIDFNNTSGGIFDESYVLSARSSTSDSQETFFTDGKNVFSLYYQSPEELFDVYQDDIQNLIKSIKFVQ